MFIKDQKDNKTGSSGQSVCCAFVTQVRLSVSKVEKSNTSAKGLLGIVNKLMAYISNLGQH